MLIDPKSYKSEKFMPIKWYGTGDQTDPLYLHFSRIVNFTIHAMAFAALNSCLWFVQEIRHPWQQLQVFTFVWAFVLGLHLVFVLSKRPSS